MKTITITTNDQSTQQFLADETGLLLLAYTNENSFVDSNGNKAIQSVQLSLGDVASMTIEDR